MIEEIARVEIAVTQKLKQRTVQLIGPGLRDCADLRAGAFSVLGAVGVGEDVEFADGVDAEQIAADAAGRDGELAGAGVFDAVQQEQILVAAAAFDGKRIAVAGAGSRALHGAVVDCAGIERDEVVEAAAVKGEFFDLFFADDAGD